MLTLERLKVSNNNKNIWEKVAESHFRDEVVVDLKSEVVSPVLRDTQHATNIQEGRRELAIDILVQMGEI